MNHQSGVTLLARIVLQMDEFKSQTFNIQYLLGMLKKLPSNLVLRYLLAGGLSYAIELSCLLLIHRFLGVATVAATAIAFWIGLVASFVLQKLLAFQDYEKTKKLISRQLSVYLLLIGFNYLFTLGVVALFPPSYIIFSRTLALVIVTTWNFAFYKRFVFKLGKTSSGRSKS
jgi:putative flippase GtrA